MRVSDLTPRQAEIVRFIRETLTQRGYPPTVREIGRAVGLKSPSAVHAQLKRLEEKGIILREPSITRAIRLLGSESLPNNLLPLVGKVTAGLPILATQNIEGYLPVPTELGKPGSHFVLRVKGDSMIGAGILDGDFLVVRQQDYCSEGDIAVVLLADEATVKRIHFGQDCVILHPENPAFSDITIRGGEPFKVLGVVTGLFRRIK